MLILENWCTAITRSRVVKAGHPRGAGSLLVCSARTSPGLMGWDLR